MKPQFNTLILLLAVSFISCDQSLPRTSVNTDNKQLPQIAGSLPLTDGKPSGNAATPAAAGKLNPAHGLPGHRCEIAVGAPLNGAPAFQTALPQSAVSGLPVQQLSVAPTPGAPLQPAIQPVANTTAISSVEPLPGISATNNSALNPAHGAPGHRCEIAVGAPLNSTPVKPVTIAAPAKKTTTGINPKHGDPGHRCDIAVGAPLTPKK